MGLLGKRFLSTSDDVREHDMNLRCVFRKDDTPEVDSKIKKSIWVGCIRNTWNPRWSFCDFSPVLHLSTYRITQISYEPSTDLVCSQLNQFYQLWQQLEKKKTQRFSLNVICEFSSQSGMFHIRSAFAVHPRLFPPPPADLNSFYEAQRQENDCLLLKWVIIFRGEHEHLRN